MSDADAGPAPGGGPTSPRPDGAPPRYRASVLIVSKDRRPVLAEAVHSACRQRAHEVIVIDDGSTDDTEPFIAREYPSVRLIRHDTSRGYIVRRNEGARLARGEVIVSIDDDAVFTGDDTVEQALADFDPARIGAVAIPYTDADTGAQVHQAAPDADRTWIVPSFRGTAYAVRRDVFLALGGFRESLVHQGEEYDLALRMLRAGWLVRAGRSHPIDHRPSPIRDHQRIDMFGRRNQLLEVYTYFPAPWHLVYLAAHAVHGVYLGSVVRRSPAMLRGVIAGLRDVVRSRGEREPLSLREYRLARELWRAGLIELEALDGRLSHPLLPPRAPQ